MKMGDAQVPSGIQLLMDDAINAINKRPRELRKSR